MLQQEVGKSAVFYELRVMVLLFLRVPANPLLPRTGAKASITCVLSAKHFNYSKD